MALSGLSITDLRHDGKKKLNGPAMRSVIDSPYGAQWGRRPMSWMSTT